jgi:hypothetical protein
MINRWTPPNSAGWWHDHNWGMGNFPLYIELRVIGFCGKIYPFIETYTKYGAPDDNCHGEYYHHNLEYIYSEEHFYNYIQTHYGEQGCKFYLGKENRKNRKLWLHWNGYINDQTIGNFFKYYTNIAMFEELFRYNKTPIWLFERRGIQPYKDYIVINPRIIDYGFAKIFDAYGAFQEISMYLGGVLGTGNPGVPPIDDETLAQAKGFDKWSFRKEPRK